MMEIFLLVVALIVAANVLVALVLVWKYRAEQRHEAAGVQPSMFYAGNTW